MGSILYDFLVDSILFDSPRYEDHFSGISDDVLANELQRYREFCLRNLETLTQDAMASPSGLRVFAGLNHIEFQTLKQSALYIHQYVLADPIFPFTAQRPGVSDTVASYLGYPTSGLDRGQLIRALRRMRTMTPMVAANYVKFLPVSKLFETPAHLPIKYSPSGFSDILPPETLEFLRNRAVVQSLRPNAEGAGWVVEEGLKRGRGIMIEFECGCDRHTRCYHYLAQELVGIDDERHFLARCHMPPEPPSADIFEAWVTQSINQAAGHIFSSLHTQVQMSVGLGTALITDSALTNEMLTRFFPIGSEVHTANVLLNIEVPFLENIEVGDLMRVRMEDGEVFENFRNELDKQLWDLQAETDADRIRVRAQKVLHDLGTVQTHSLKMKADDMRKGALAQSFVLSAGLTYSALSMPTTTMKLIAGVGALAGVAKLMADYRSALRSNPAFFLWKVLGK